MDSTQKFKDKQAIQMLPQLSLGPSISHDRLAPIEEVKLAATAISLNIRLRSSDMPVHMQERALRYTRSFLDQSAPKSLSKFNPTHLARALKKEFDSLYGPAWHCVVGTSFGSFVTHSPGGFVYFSIDSLSVLLFKTEVKVVTEPGA
ncbi:dynein light chain LC6, flagellar outer arm-like [Fagus crenata]